MNTVAIKIVRGVFITEGKLISPHGAERTNHFFPGDVVEIPEKAAQDLIQTTRATLWDPDPETAEENGDPDPGPKKGKDKDPDKPDPGPKKGKGKK